MSMFGGGFGGPGSGGGAGAVIGGGAKPAFAGIPTELAASVSRLEATEPVHPAPDVTFAHRSKVDRPLTMWRLVTRYRASFLAATALVVLETVLLQSGPLLIQLGIDHGIAPGRPGVLIAAALAFLASIGLGWFASSARIVQCGRLAANAMRDLRIRVFGHLQRLSMDYYGTEKAGVILTRMSSDIEALQQLFQEGLAQFAVQGLTMVVVTAVLFIYNASLAAITLLLVLPLLIFLTIWFRRKSDVGYIRQRDAIAALFSDLSESLHGTRVVTAHNRQDRNIANHRSFTGRYRDASDYAGHIASIYGPATSVVGMGAMAALLFIGGSRVLDNTLSIGVLTAFVLYLNAFFAPVQQLVQLYTNYQQARAAVVKLSELLVLEPSVAERPSALDLPPARGEIVFDGVTFGYSAQRPVLHGVSVRISPGETVAVVGATGAGKSTMAKLITRLHDPLAGRVLIDGHDLKTLTLTSLRRQIGVVPQEPFMFAGTLRDNIAFARPHATDDEVWAAVDEVGLREFVSRQPLGLDAPLHERGQSVSSGQRQLLALARAFLAGPRIVVLDEATSNLDLQSELMIERALDRLLEGRTALLIAHRLSTAMRADRILVIHDGYLAESGSHAELLAAQGHYASMFATWSAHAAP